jgi:hypothetical protein
MSEALKIKQRLVDKCVMLGIEIPVWVPENLIIEFADCAVHHGEEQAASYIRKLKRENEASEFSRLVSRA